MLNEMHVLKMQLEKNFQGSFLTMSYPLFTCRFDIIKKLGQGTYGKVQLGINKETGQEVAIKTIKKSKIETEADLIRIRREVQIMSSVQHPNIIHIYEGTYLIPSIRCIDVCGWGKYATETFSFNGELFTISFYVKRFVHKIRRLWEAKKFFILLFLVRNFCRNFFKIFSTYFFCLERISLRKMFTVT